MCVVAPHPDDELLGAGGTILSAVQNGSSAYWLIATGISEKNGFSSERVAQREKEIASVSETVPFTETRRLDFPTTTLDSVAGNTLIDGIKQALESWRPDIVIIPWKDDAHTDHLAVYNAAMAATKMFRAPYVNTVLAMEILSETNFPRSPGFAPNWYVDISDHLERKIELLRTFESEFAPHPFPRSEDAVRALATLRGSESGYRAAEAFHLIRHRNG
ncbi:MAG: PIG-L family deacetylase [Spirochaeta sp.]|nr:PIG-L family deacetylase [Spirochaeta sp.]